MKILVINISLRPKSQQLFFPIGLGYIVSAIDRAGFDLEILDIDAHRYSDETVARLIGKKHYDVVTFGCIVTGYKIVKTLAELIKVHRKEILIICGNSVASSIPELLLSKTEVDIAVIGEGDITIVELLRAIENKEPLEQVNGICFKRGDQIVATSPRKIIADLDSIPLINWDLFDMDIYIPKSKTRCPKPCPIDYDSIRLISVNTARGCLYHCTFCYHVFIKDKYRVRSPQSICTEIKLLKEKYGINYIAFSDELTFYSIKQCENFVDTFLKENLQIYWDADCRANLFEEKDFGLVKKLKAAGCNGLGYSLESTNPEILRAMNKNISSRQFSVQSKVLQRAGLATWTSLVIGYPQETETSINETFNCCYENDIYPSVGYILPQPGTPIYDFAIKTGKIKDKESYLLSTGDRQDFSINFTRMDQDRIEALVGRNLQKISDKLNLGLKKDGLIKTGVYRSKN